MIKISFVLEEGFEKDVLIDKQTIDRNIIRIEKFITGSSIFKVGHIQLQALTKDERPKILECELMGDGQAKINKLYDEYEILREKYKKHGFDVRGGSFMECPLIQ